MSWDGVRGTLQWMLLLLLIGVVSASGAVVHWWSSKDALLTASVRDKFAELLPDCEIDFATVRLVDASRLEFSHLTIHKRATHELLAKFPRLVAEIDPEMLGDYHRVVVSKIHLDSPELYVIRNAAREWSWAGIRRPDPSEVLTPTIQVDNATINLGFQSQPNGPVHFIRNESIQLRMFPLAHNQYQLEAEGNSDAVGPVTINGKLNNNIGTWSLAGQAGKVQLQDQMLDLAARFDPRVQQQLTALQSKANQNRYVSGNDPFRTASTDAASPPALTNPNQVPGQSLVRADLDVHFECSRSEKDGRIDYRVNTAIQHGQISDVLLPIPLYDMKGKIELTPNRIVISNLKAANGECELYVNGVAHKVTTGWKNEFQVKASQLNMDARIRTFLPGKLARLYDSLSPVGIFDLDVDYASQPQAKPKITLRRMTVENAQVMHELFQYPVSNAHGSVTQAGQVFQVNMEGVASGRPVLLTGTYDHGSPGKDFHLKIQGEDFPFDKQFTSALAQPEQAKVRETLESLRMTGSITGTVEIIRDARTDGKVKLKVDGHLKQGTGNFVRFPYQVTQLAGRVIYDPFDRDAWFFEDVTGRHGDAHLSGDGVFDLTQGNNALALNLALVRVPVDHDLQVASTTVNENLDFIWKDFGLGGTVDVEQVQLSWIPGQDPVVKLLGIQWKDGTITPKVLPYTWDNVAGALEWDGSRLKIHSLHGWHGHTYFQLDGSKPDAPAFVQCPVSDAVAWRLHFGDLWLMKLNPDDELQRALPVYIAKSLETVQLQGPLDINLGLDMKGWNSDEELVTATWWSLTGLPGNSLLAGVPLTDVIGKVKVEQGTWNGEQLYVEGYVELESLKAMELPVKNVRGPFLFDGERFTIGTPKFVDFQTTHNEANIYRGQQLKGEMYTGQVALDAEAYLKEDPEQTTYGVEMNVQDVELAEWAKQQGIEKMRLNGKVNGTLQFTGQGTSATAPIGEGWVQITPAALYELPVFAQMFALLNFRPVDNRDNTAFTYAYSDFKIGQGNFNFSRIELVGDAMSLLGRGTVGYAGSNQQVLNLEFFSKANNSIPFLKPLIERLGSNWIYIQVVGTMANPTPIIKPRIPILDDTFRGFMKSLEPGGPRKNPPRPPRVGG